MGNMPFPLTGEGSDDLKRQVWELLRQIYEEKIGGADLGDVFSTPGDVLTLALAAFSGLTKEGNELAVQVSPTGGLQITSSGLGVKSGTLSEFAAGTGLSFYQDTAPDGWTIQNLDDKVIYITKGSAAGGQTGGGAHSTGTWVISALSADSHTHSGPSHTHTGPSHTHSGPNHDHPLTWASQENGVRMAIDDPSTHITGAGGTGATGAEGTGATGASGTGATGTASAAGVSSGGTWRIAGYCFIVCKKD